jgi:hypothetical protein
VSPFGALYYRTLHPSASAVGYVLSSLTGLGSKTTQPSYLDANVSFFLNAAEVSCWRGLCYSFELARVALQRTEGHRHEAKI